MNWKQIGPHLFNKDEIVIISEDVRDDGTYLRIGLRGGHSIEFRQDSEFHKNVLEIWEDFYRKAYPGNKPFGRF